MKNKLPALQFYVGDWRKDPGVQSLDLFTRGLWFEMLCIMHESEERGVLLLNGKPMPEKHLARFIGITLEELQKSLNEMEEIGIFSKRVKDGAIFSRRMVKDERILEVRRKAGKMGGNPNLLNQNSSKRQPNTQPNVNHPSNQILTPSFSSSVSSSSSLNKKKINKKKISFDESEYGQDKKKFIDDWENSKTAEKFPFVDPGSVYDFMKLKGNEYKYIDWLSAAQVWVNKNPNANEWKSTTNNITLPHELNTDANRRIAEAITRNANALNANQG